MEKASTSNSGWRLVKEAQSFGILSRCVRALKNGELIMIIDCNHIFFSVS
jgi:hypothetical protein